MFRVRGNSNNFCIVDALHLQSNAISNESRYVLLSVETKQIFYSIRDSYNQCELTLRELQYLDHQVDYSKIATVNVISLLNLLDLNGDTALQMVETLLQLGFPPIRMVLAVGAFHTRLYGRFNRWAYFKLLLAAVGESEIRKILQSTNIYDPSSCYEQVGAIEEINDRMVIDTYKRYYSGVEINVASFLFIRALECCGQDISLPRYLYCYTTQHHVNYQTFLKCATLLDNQLYFIFEHCTTKIDLSEISFYQDKLQRFKANMLQIQENLNLPRVIAELVGSYCHCQ